MRGGIRLCFNFVYTTKKGQSYALNYWHFLTFVNHVRVYSTCLLLVYFATSIARIAGIFDANWSWRTNKIAYFVFVLGRTKRFLRWTNQRGILEWHFNDHYSFWLIISGTIRQILEWHFNDHSSFWLIISGTIQIQMSVKEAELRYFMIIMQHQHFWYMSLGVFIFVTYLCYHLWQSKNLFYHFILNLIATSNFLGEEQIIALASNYGTRTNFT